MITEKVIASSLAKATEPAAKRIGEALVDYIGSKAKIVKNDLIDPFEKYIENTLSTHKNIQTIINRGAPININDIYIPLTIESDGNSEKITSFPKALDNNNILVVDTAGMGKSTLAKKIFIECWQNRKLIPIFIELRRLLPQQKITEYITDQINIYSVKKTFEDKYISFLCQRGDFLLILDGLDEVKDDQKTDTIENINYFTSAFSKTRVLMTSREEPYISSIQNFHFYKIKQLEKDESFELIRKFDPGNKISSALIDKLNQQAETYLEFIKNPLLTTLLYKAYEYKQQIPLKKHIFYRQVFDALFEGHDLTKDGFERQKKTKLDIDEFEATCRGVGLISMKEQKIEFTRDEFNIAAKKIENIVPQKKISPSDLLLDLTNRVPLFCKDGNNFRWVHRSMQEYFAALALHRDISNGNSIVSSLMQKDSTGYYINTISLYHDIDRKKFRNNIALPLIKEFKHQIEQEFRKIRATNKISTASAMKRISCTILTDHVILPNEIKFNDTDGSLTSEEVKSTFSLLYSINPAIAGFNHGKRTTNIIATFPLCKNTAIQFLAKINNDFSPLLTRHDRTDDSGKIHIDHPVGMFTNEINLNCNSPKNFDETTSTLMQIYHTEVDINFINNIFNILTNENEESIKFTEILSEI